MLKRVLKKLSPAEPLDYGLAEYREANRLLDQPPALVVIGDSIVSGWFHAGTLFKKPGVVNRGIGGQTSAQVLVRFRQDVIELKPRGVLIVVGTNDIAEGRDARETVASIASCCDLAAFHRIRAMVGAVLPVRPEAEDRRPVSRIKTLNRELRSYAERNGHRYVDFYSACADHSGYLNPSFAKDPVHLSPAGYERLEMLLPDLIA